MITGHQPSLVRLSGILKQQHECSNLHLDRLQYQVHTGYPVNQCSPLSYWLVAPADTNAAAAFVLLFLAPFPQ